MTTQNQSQSSQGFTVEERVKALFWSKVRILNPYDCWEWTGMQDEKGYGIFFYDQRQRKAHRISHEALKGPIPSNHHVLHHCDNPPCVNPRHLWTGTDKDNSQDALAKGRLKTPKLTGENNPHSKLTREDVLEIRYLYSNGRMDQIMLAKKYGVSQTTISSIVLFRTWRHLG